MGKLSATNRCFVASAAEAAPCLPDAQQQERIQRLGRQASVCLLVLPLAGECYVCRDTHLPRGLWTHNFEVPLIGHCPAVALQ